MNNVVLIGRLTKDPDLKYLQNGTALCKFGLAVDKGLSKDKKQEMETKGQHTADFINISAWGKMAENCANYLKKGRLVGIQGRIQTGSYTANNGSKRYTFEVVANNVEFLEWGDKYNQQSNYVPDGFMEVDDDNIPF